MNAETLLNLAFRSLVAEDVPDPIWLPGEAAQWLKEIAEGMELKVWYREGRPVPGLYG